MRKWVTVLIFMPLFFNAQAKVVKMATVDWPPYFSKKLKGQGLIVRLIEESLKVKGHSLVVNYMPWKRAMSLAERGKKAHALLGCFYTKEREKIYNFSKEISSAAFHFLISKKKFVDRVSSPAQLKNLQLGKVRGYAMSEKLTNFKGLGQIKEVNKLTQLFGMVERGKVDVILENPLVARFEFNKKYPGKDYPLKDAGPDFPASDGSLSGGLHICWSKRNKDVQAFLPDFDEGLKAIKANGTYNKVRREFGLK